MTADTDIESALVVAERVRTTIEALRFEALGEHAFTLSIAVAVNRSASALDILIHRADQALYAAKESGRNRVCHGINLQFDQPPTSQPGSSALLGAMAS